ncbi:MAG TPA: hypothetical protein VL242_05385, partial [Sorangium sp.]|nr:hypothetical protein [Sorangium sp.]
MGTVLLAIASALILIPVANAIDVHASLKRRAWLRVIEGIDLLLLRAEPRFVQPARGREPQLVGAAGAGAARRRAEERYRVLPRIAVNPPAVVAARNAKGPPLLIAARAFAVVSCRQDRGAGRRGQRSAAPRGLV